MLIDRLCSPALIYLAFSIIQLILDMSQGKFKLAIAKLFICLIFTYLLNLLCKQKLSQLSWIIISLPFLFMGYMSLLLVYALGFSDLNGNDIDKTKKTKDASKTTESKDVTPVEETLSVTAFEPFSALEKMSCKGKTKPYSKKRDPVQSSAKKNENLNNDVKKLELGAL